MSFGKDQGHLSNIPAFGGGRSVVQRAKNNARRPNRSGGGGAPYWKNTYKPPMIGSDIGRLIPGDYVQEVTHDGETLVQETFPYFMFREHVMKTAGNIRGGICSAGALFANKQKSLQCHGCTIYWEDFNERKNKKARGDTSKGPRRIGMRDQFVFNWFDYGLYFEMPETDNNGQFRMNPKTNQPYTTWEKGNPQDPRFHGRPWKQGMLLPWVMGVTYKDVLMNYADIIGQDCSSCGTRGAIRCVLKMCSNCNAGIYDPNNCTLTAEQRDQIDNYPFTCQNCGFNGYVDEVIECAACQVPKRAQLWDVDLQVQAVGSTGQQTFLQVLNWSEVRPIQVVDASVIDTIKPQDLPKRFRPTPLETQAKIWGVTTVQAQHAPPPQQMQMPSMGQMPMQQPAYPQQFQQPTMQPQPMMQQPMPTGMPPQGFQQPGPSPYMQPAPQAQLPPMQQMPAPQQAQPQQPMIAPPVVPYGTQQGS